jgi:hypothetical protein
MSMHCYPIQPKKFHETSQFREGADSGHGRVTNPSWGIEQPEGHAKQTNKLKHRICTQHNKSTIVHLLCRSRRNVTGGIGECIRDQSAYLQLIHVCICSIYLLQMHLYLDTPFTTQDIRISTTKRCVPNNLSNTVFRFLCTLQHLHIPHALTSLSYIPYTG